MALIVEDGSIISGAESYASVANTDAYNTSFVGDASWIDASEPEKERALRQATQYLDTIYFQQWRGERVQATQSLQWPRIGAVYNDGVAIPANSIPVPLLRATMELAIKAAGQEEPLIVDVDAPSANIRREKVKAGPVEQDIEYVGGNTSQKRFTIVENLVLPLIHGANMVERS